MCCPCVVEEELHCKSVCDNLETNDVCRAYHGQENGSILDKW